ncbi:MAG TPA: hypothetical protein PLN69_08325 [bacterium]|nr:hypothetical protein [bacterium]
MLDEIIKNTKWFSECVKSEMNSYFDRLGYFLDETPYESVVVYRKGDQRIDFSYSPEDYPQFVLMIGLGLLSETFDKIKIFECIGLWFLMRQIDVVIDNKRMHFCKPEELEEALKYIKNEILMNYENVIFHDKAFIKQAIEKWEQDNRLIQDKEIQKRKLMEAEELFKQRLYGKAKKVLLEMDYDTLSNYYKKMYDIALKRG